MLQSRPGPTWEGCWHLSMNTDPGDTWPGPTDHRWHRWQCPEWDRDHDTSQQTVTRPHSTLVQPPPCPEWFQSALYRKVSTEALQLATIQSYFSYLSLCFLTCITLMYLWNVSTTWNELESTNKQGNSMISWGSNFFPFSQFASKSRARKYLNFCCLLKINELYSSILLCSVYTLDL